MQTALNIVFILFFLWLIFQIKRFDRNNRKKLVADEPFYIPGVLEKKPIEKELRKVSDITTEMLRDERDFNNKLKRLMWTKEYMELFEAKLFFINIRLSIKQTRLSVKQQNHK